MKSMPFDRLLRFAKRAFGDSVSSKSDTNIENDPYSIFLDKVRRFEKILSAEKAKITLKGPGRFWYPYGTLSVFFEFGNVLKGANRDILNLINDMPVADIGAADGDVAFFLEWCGIKNIHSIDYGPTNCNRLEGARMLKKVLGSSVEIHDINLDTFFQMPNAAFGLVLLWGTLYHLKNPFHMLETLARCSKFCLISTRIASFFPDNKTAVSTVPLAYLLDEKECNNDNTNFWVFSEAGLRRILNRSGWDILDFSTRGSNRSTPASMEKTQRAFCLVKSRLLT
jgi:tRNA (mo5U34)-methyltransferase